MTVESSNVADSSGVGLPSVPLRTNSQPCWPGPGSILSSASNLLHDPPSVPFPVQVTLVPTDTLGATTDSPVRADAAPGDTRATIEKTAPQSATPTPRVRTRRVRGVPLIKLPSRFRTHARTGRGALNFFVTIALLSDAAIAANRPIAAGCRPHHARRARDERGKYGSRPRFWHGPNGSFPIPCPVGVEMGPPDATIPARRGPDGDRSGSLRTGGLLAGVGERVARPGDDRCGVHVVRVGEPGVRHVAEHDLV